MSSTLVTLGIDRLSLDERILLVEEIWSSIASETDAVPLSDVQRADLLRRLRNHEASPGVGSTWEEVKARLQNQQL